MSQETVAPHRHATLKRWLVGLGVPLLLLAGALLLYLFGNPVPCLLHELTGLYCPGCGTGRATTALLHLRPVQAFSYNPLYVIYLPFLAYYSVAAYVHYVFRTRRPPTPDLKMPVTVAILVSIVLFWILRNIPVYPFTMLAP